ncbi:hypothetical protein AB0901_17455 [Streptomyces roseifaciens]
MVLSGTVTMPGSITHQLVKAGKGERSDRTKWVDEERFRVHHHLPIIRSDDGGERSMWPQKWPLDYLKSIEHTRSFKKNFLNDPMSVDSEYWAEADFTYGTFPVARAYLSVDGAVTTNAAGDFTGLSVVGYAPATVGAPARCLVQFAQAVKLKGEPLRRRVMQLLESYPEVGAVLVGSNQGSDLWHEVLHDLPVRVITLLLRTARSMSVRSHGVMLRILAATTDSAGRTCGPTPDGAHDVQSSWPSAAGTSRWEKEP